MYRTEGAVGVALVNAIRGGAVSLLTGALFCSSATPNRCVGAWTACSAAVETAGGVTWLSATHKVSKSAQLALMLLQLLDMTVVKLQWNCCDNVM